MQLFKLKYFYYLLRASRPRQWIKNGILFAALVFNEELFNLEYFLKTFVAFLYFCGISSAIYIINDCFDYEKDRLHPIKKNRPVASGLLPLGVAWFFAIFLLILLIPASFLFVGKFFGIVVSMYVLLQFAYNALLKRLIIIDALAIAGGFILRAYAGALAIPLSVSSWLVLAITGVSLLLAFGKRRAERTLLEAQGMSNDSTRAILKHYPDTLLDSMISVSASMCIVTYSLFTFFVSPENLRNDYLSSLLPHTLVGVRFLMLTIPVVIYLVARYLYVIYEKREGESPERVLLNDKPLFYSGIVWVVMIILITGFQH